MQSSNGLDSSNVQIADKIHFEDADMRMVRRQAGAVLRALVLLGAPLQLCSQSAPQTPDPQMVRDVTENKTNIKHLQEKRALVGSITALILFPILTGLIIKKWIDPRGKVGERLDRPTAEDY